MTTEPTLTFALSAMTVLRGVLSEETPRALLTFLHAKTPDAEASARAYGDYLCLLLEDGRPLSALLYDLVRYGDHAAARAYARGEALSPALSAAVAHDLRTLGLLATVTCADLKRQMAKCHPEYKEAISALPEMDEAADSHLQGDWNDLLPELAAFWRTSGWGLYAKHHVFAIDERAALQPMADHDPVTLADLIGYRQQQETLLANTRALLAGRGAAHAMLYGDKGTGKSSTVKAVVNSLAPQGLRMVCLQKSQIPLLPALLKQLADNPLKFVVFLDDLSFADIDDDYTTLKAIIEGGQQVKASNVALYVTSNRRHLVRETFTARAGDEAHLSDTLDEASSLSDRFALTLTYLKLDRAGYLEMIEQMAERFTLTADESYHAKALAYAVRKGGYTPRVAQQFTLAQMRAE